MEKKVTKAKNGLSGEIIIPPDKSISHRAVIISSITNGTSLIKGFSNGKDCLTTLELCKCLGIDYELNNNNLSITSDGLLKAPATPLNCGNSGTTMRLISGILAAQNFKSVLIGDHSLSNRPMKRVIEPLSLMGAEIKSNNFKAPLKINGKPLNGINYKSKLSSAQVKSCVLLAGLFAKDQTVFSEPYLSRNHTELMLKYFGANIKTDGLTSQIEKSELKPCTIEVAGDISSAAYFIAATLIVPNSKIILKNVGLNPTRTGLLDILKIMGADIEILDKRLVSNEFAGDIKIKSSNLKACEISGDLIPRLIDEIPIIAVLASRADGTTIIKDAEDLRNKESDRIKSIVTELKKIGADIEETNDGMIIHGKKTLTGNAKVETYHDHRLAMSLYVAGLICEKEILIKGFEWADISMPEFNEYFETLLI